MILRVDLRQLNYFAPNDHVMLMKSRKSETMFTRNCELDNILRENLVK